MSQPSVPNGMFPCLYIKEEEIKRVKKTKKPFAKYITNTDYFKLTNRIDNIFIQRIYLFVVLHLANARIHNLINRAI